MTIKNISEDRKSLKLKKGKETFKKLFEGKIKSLNESEAREVLTYLEYASPHSMLWCMKNRWNLVYFSEGIISAESFLKQIMSGHKWEKAAEEIKTEAGTKDGVMIYLDAEMLAFYEHVANKNKMTIPKVLEKVVYVEAKRHLVHMESELMKLKMQKLSELNVKVGGDGLTHC